MSESDAQFYRPDLNWDSLWPSINNPQAGALPAPRILERGDTLQAQVAADGTVLTRFAIGCVLWEPASGQAGTAFVADSSGNPLVTITYDGRNTPLQRLFNPPILSANGVRVSAPSGTIRVTVQGFSRFGN